MEIALRWLSLASGAIFRLGRNRAIRIAVAAGLTIYFAYYVAGFQPRRFWNLEPKVDTLIQDNQARDLFATGVYPPQVNAGDFSAAFPYPPPAVVMFRALGIFGTRILTASWITLAIGGVLIIFRSSVAGENGDTQSSWLALGAIALLFTDVPISWDLRLGNYNAIYLALVLAAYSLLDRRPRFAGALLGLSISLKLYSGLLLLWLFVSGPKTALYAALIALVALWVAIPIALFGAGPTISLYGGWSNQLRLIGGNGVYPFLARHAGPALVTLRRAMIVLTGAQADAPITRWLLGALWTIWLAALGWYASRAFTGGYVVAPSRAALADWTILLLAPLPLSPWLEPYHAVPILPGTILCLMVALDETAADSDRMIVVASLAALLLMQVVRVHLPIRGFELFAEFLVLVVGLGLIRPRLPIASQRTHRSPALSSNCLDRQGSRISF